MVCKYCGHENEEGALFCSVCGMLLQEDGGVEKADREKKNARENGENGTGDKGPGGQAEKSRCEEERQQAERAWVEKLSKVEEERNQEHVQYEAELRKMQGEIDSFVSQADFNRAQMKKKGRNTIIAGIAGGAVALFLLIVIIGIENEYQYTKSEYQRYQSKYLDAQKELEAAQESIDAIWSYFGTDMVVDITDLYNDGGDGSRISDELYSDEMRYLEIEADVYLKPGLELESIPLDISIFDPDGSLMQGSSSPEEYTSSVSVEPGGKLSWGWGNEDESAYEAGEYEIYIIYENSVVGYKSVLIW